MPFLDNKNCGKKLFLPKIVLPSIISILFVINFAFIARSQNICPFPLKGNYNLSASCFTTSTTGIEEGILNIDYYRNLNISGSSTFIYNPGYYINLGTSSINFSSSSSPTEVKKGYLCIQDNDNDNCWLNPSFSTSSTCSPTSLKRYANIANSQNYWGDCNDNNNQQCYLLNEMCGDDIDNNCNGLIDEGCYYGCLGFPDDFSAAAYGDKIYYLGGNQFLEYNTATNSWTILPFPSNLFLSIQGHTAVVYENKMYVFGGIIKALDGGSLPSNNLFVYDFISKSWQQIGTSFYFIEHSATVLDNKMYVFGKKGYYYGGFELDEMYSYDFSSNQWTRLPNFYSATRRTALGGKIAADPTRRKIYIFGGQDVRGFADPIGGDVFSFNIDSNSYLFEGSSLYQTIIEHSVVIYQNKMYVFGGRGYAYDETLGDYIPDFNLLKAFDLDNKTWERKQDDILARRKHQAVVVGSKMYVFGGLNNSIINMEPFKSTLHDLRIYDFAANSWTKGNFGPISRYNHSAVVYDNKMYVYGGLCGVFQYQRSDMKSFDFQTQTWKYEPNAPVSKNLHSAIVYNNKMYLLGNNSVTWREVNPSGFINDPFMLVYNFLNKSWSRYQATGYFLPTTQEGTGGENQYAYISNNKMYKAGEYSYSISGTNLSNHKRLVECTLEEPPECTIINPELPSGIIITREKGYSTTFFNNQRYIYGGVGTGSGCNGGTGICDDRAYHSAALEGNQLYIFGGYNYTIFTTTLIVLPTLKKLDMVTGNWTTLASDSIPRYGHSAVIYGNKMYVVGGKTTDEIPLGDVRIYDINQNAWQAGIPEPQF